MKRDFDTFRARNATIVVVVPHDARKTEEYWRSEELPFIGVPDEDGTLANLYGQEWKLLKLGRMPAMFVIDRKGVLAFAQYGQSMSDIPRNSSILKILDGLK